MAEARRDRWHRLDNTANLFPVITSKRYANVYRLSLTLDEPVDPELLQRSLEKVLPWFSAFRVRLRHGLFWHYLETNDATPTVQEEDDYPCRYIDPRQNHNFLFRMTYFGNRVNLEVYHVLSDGTGALQLLMATVCQYLMQAHPTAFTEEQKARKWYAEHAADTEDSYAANYTPTKKSNFRIGRGHKITGERTLLDALSVIHAHIGLAGLKAKCKEHGATVGQYLTACVAWGVWRQMNGRPIKHPLNVFLPVNLRPFFGSTTTLNFFSNIFISLRFDEPGITFDAVLAEVKKQFEDKVSREAMLEKISYTVGGGYSAPVRMVPLPMKNLALRLIYESSAKSSTLSLTNVGVVKLPEEFSRYVKGAYALLSTAPREPFKVAALSYGDMLTLSFTSTLREPALQRAIIRTLAEDGLDITVETNGVDYESL